MALCPSRAACRRALLIGIFRLGTFARLALKEGPVVDPAKLLLSQAFHFAYNIQSIRLVQGLRIPSALSRIVEG